MNKDEKQRLSEIREKLNSLDDFQTFIIENKIIFLKRIYYM